LYIGDAKARFAGKDADGPVELRHPVTLFDLEGAVVDGGSIWPGSAGYDDVEDGRTVALGHALASAAPSCSGSSTRMPPTPIARAPRHNPSR